MTLDRFDAFALRGGLVNLTGARMIRNLTGEDHGAMIGINRNRVRLTQIGVRQGAFNLGNQKRIVGLVGRRIIVMFADMMGGHLLLIKRSTARLRRLQAAIRCLIARNIVRHRLRSLGCRLGKNRRFSQQHRQGRRANYFC